MAFPTFKRVFPVVFSSIFFAALGSWLFLVFYLPYRDKRENKLMHFRAAVSKVKLRHGSDRDYFLDLSDGSKFLFAIPGVKVVNGDSLIKIADE